MHAAPGAWLFIKTTCSPHYKDVPLAVLLAFSGTCRHNTPPPFSRCLFFFSLHCFLSLSLSPLTKGEPLFFFFNVLIPPTPPTSFDYALGRFAAIFCFSRPVWVRHLVSSQDQFFSFPFSSKSSSSAWSIPVPFETQIKSQTAQAFLAPSRVNAMPLRTSNHSPSFASPFLAFQPPDSPCVCKLASGIPLSHLVSGAYHAPRLPWTALPGS